MAYTYKKYIDEKEEIRCGFKVSSNRKKVWNIQLGLIEEFKRICKKYGLKYYADSGTLLGAIRHKGFIPRDDDTDFVMFRKDYDRFIEIASKELPTYYILQSNFCRGFAKLRNENTVAIDNLSKNDSNLKGISLDIFPLDYVSKYKIINIVQKYILIIIRGILVSMSYKKVLVDASMFKKIMQCICRFLFKYVNYDRLWEIYDNICKSVIFKDESRVVDRWGSFDLNYEVKDFDNFKKVDFENIKIFIPCGYYNILKRLYGDYMKPVIFPGGHNCLYSVEKSYKEIAKNGKIDNSQLFII